MKTMTSLLVLVIITSILEEGLIVSISNGAIVELSHELVKVHQWFWISDGRQ